MIALITGYSGFLGSYILEALRHNHFYVVKIGRSKNADIHWDFFSDDIFIPKSDVFVHCAGLAHQVAKNNLDSEFFRVNELATINICRAINKSGNFPNTFIFISTVAVYGLDEGELISEKSLLHPKTAYAKSKCNAEKFLQVWAENHNVKLMILRLPLVVGVSPRGNLASMINAIRRGYYFRFVNRTVRRSMVLAQDVANFIVTLYGKEGIINLTDGTNCSFAELEDYIAKKFNRKIVSIPYVIVHLLSFIGDFIPLFPINSYRLKKLKSTLTFSTKKAMNFYGWKPSPVIGNF